MGYGSDKVSRDVECGRRGQGLGLRFQGLWCAVRYGGKWVELKRNPHSEKERMKETEKETDRHRHTDTQTHRHTDTHDTQSHRQKVQIIIITRQVDIPVDRLFLEEALD